MSLLWALVVVLLVLTLAGWPALGPWRHGYGYYPSGALAVVLVVLVVLLLTGRV